MTDASAENIGVIDESTPVGRIYEFEDGFDPGRMELVTANKAKLHFRDDNGEDVIMSRFEWDDEWAPAVTRTEDPDGSPESSVEVQQMPGTQNELVEAVAGGSVIMVPRDLLDSMTSARDALDDATANFKEVAEQRRQAKDDMEAAQDHYNKCSAQVLSYASRTGFPAGSPLAQAAEIGDDAE